jgi:hypothetical protein
MGDKWSAGSEAEMFEAQSVERETLRRQRSAAARKPRSGKSRSADAIQGKGGESHQRVPRRPQVKVLDLDIQESRVIGCVYGRVAHASSSDMLAKRTVENPKNRQATRSNIDNIESGKIVIANNRKITISECGLMQVGRKEVASAFVVVNDFQRQPEVRSLDFRFEVSVQGVGRFRFFTAIQANMSDMLG